MNKLLSTLGTCIMITFKQEMPVYGDKAVTVINTCHRFLGNSSLEVPSDPARILSFFNNII